MLSNATLPVAVTLLAVTFGFAPELPAADKYTLHEPVTDARVFRVSHRLKVNGQLEAAVGDGKSLTLKLKVQATHRYLERRLSGTGRLAAALRSLRHYDKAEAGIKVAARSVSSRLRNDRRLIVASGKRSGIVTHSPAGSLSASEVELLQVPGDSLAVHGLLPPNPIEPDGTWEPESWAIQMLTGTEAVLKSSLSCKLDSVTGDLAKVTFKGQIEGATAGAATDIELSGFYLFDLKAQFIKRVELTQKEKRSVGAVSPGMKAEAQVVLERSAEKTAGPLDDAAVANIPLEPANAVMQLAFETPWRIHLHHGRNWHVFHQTGDTAVLRLLENGSLIAQCNVTRIASAAAGKHTSGKQFQIDVHKALGKRLKSITKAEQFETPDERFVYRVTAVGKSNGIDMHWLYYLCAAPSGRQVSFVFACETKLLERLGNRDLGIVSSLQFLAEKPRPTLR